jgi:bifunctional non-homologous end joining protein LigD
LVRHDNFLITACFASFPLEHRQPIVIDRIPIRARPMLALLVPAPFHRPGWVFEEKYDGIRILAYKEGAKVTLLSRNDLDRTATFTDIATAIGQLRDRTLLLDGEVVAFDSKRVSRFQLLQRGDFARRFAVFDCLYRNGRDLRSEPLSRRRHELEATLGELRERNDRGRPTARAARTNPAASSA